MADDLLVRIDATTAGYEAALARAEAETAKFNESLRKTQLSMARLDKQLNDDMARKLRERNTAIREVGTAFGLVGAAAAVGVGLVIRSTMNFDTAMSAVEAATRAGADEMDQFRAAALRFGQSTRYSATEAAGAITELAKAGVSNSDILGGALQGSLNLAAAAMIDVSQAASITAVSLNQFGLSGASASHVADVFAAAAGKANGEVTDIAETMKYVGPIAHQLGISLEETAGATAELAQNGILGSQAGTSLRGMLASLTSPSAAAAKEMKSLGINVYDARGNFIGFAGVAEQLKEHLGNLSQADRNEALGRIFSNQQLVAAQILYSGGGKAVDQWTKKVNDSGFASEQAAIKMDNLSGDLEQLRGALETAFISTGEDSQGGLRQMVQTVTDLVQAYNSLPGPVKSGAFALAGITAAAGLGVFAVSRLVTSYADLRKNMATLRGTADMQGAAMTGLNKQTIRLRVGAGVAAAALYGLDTAIGDSNKELHSMVSVAADAAAGFSVGGPWGAAIGGAVGVLQLFGDQSAQTAQATEELASSLDAQTGALTANTREVVINQLQQKGAFDAARALGLSLGTVTQAALGNAAALAVVNDATAKFVEAGSGARVGEQVSAASILNKILGEQTGELHDATKATKDKATADRQAKGAATGLGDAMSGAAKDTSKMDKALKEAHQAATETGKQFITLGDDLDNASVSLDQWIHQLAQQAAALRDFRINAQEAAQKGLRDGLIAALQAAGPEGALRMRQLANASKEQIGQANQAWQAGQRQIELYANAVAKVPHTAGTKLNVDSAEALHELGVFQYQIDQLHGKTVILRTTGGHAVTGGAEGGTIGGPRHPYGDKMLILAAPGEEVISNRHGQADHFRADRAAGRIPRYGEGGTVGRYADGGTVSTTAQTPAQIAAEQARKEQAARERRERLEAARERRDQAALAHLEHTLDRLRETLSHQHSLTPGGLLRRLDRPEDTPDFGDIRKAFHAMKLEVHDVAHAERDLYAARMAARHGTRQVVDTEKALEAARGKEHKDKDEIKNLEDRLAAQRKNAKATDQDLTKAEKDLSNQRDQLSAATDKWKQAQQDLIDQAKAIRDTVLGTGGLFGGTGEASTAQGLRAKLADAANQAETFDRMLHKLRKRHLDKDIIQQLIDEGPTPEAVALAQSLARAPASLINRINNQQHALEDAANQIGLFGVGGRGRHHHRHHIGSGGSGGGGGDVNYNANFNGPITVPSVRKLADAILHKQRQAVRIAGGA